MTSPPAAIVDLDEFRLVRILGQGSMGAVYLGYDTVLERDVAIKVIRRRGVDDDARTRFLTEARAIARLDHPNVITIYRASTTRDGHPYLVQELVRGDSLDRVALPIPSRRVVEIALGIARGLAAAHRRGILHRDIKPANVMIDDAGTPKLLDFGVAKLSHATTAPAPAPRSMSSGVADTVDVDATAPGPAQTITHTSPALDEARHTIAGSSVGTPRYMAPEVWRGVPASARSDLYSLGVMLYELVAGRAPHEQAELVSLRHAVLEGPPPEPIATADLDPDLASIIMSCLAREPVDRPESADDIVHRLERILVGAPAVPEGNPYPGLAPFAAERRAVFYGRGADISAVVDRLRSDPLVVVAGDSGIGKSSLCRAGVVPAVVAGALGDARTWAARTITLGRHAMAALRDSLGIEPDLAIDDIARAIGVSPTAGTLVFFDQLEEVVTLNDPREAAAAASLIAELARGIPGVKVLISVRGDFLTRVAALPGLGPAMTRSLHVLRVLSLADARDAVVGPARAKGVRFETEAMVETLASSIADEPGALPLLSFALAELWERRDVDRATIPASALDAIGGVAGALARHADAVIGALAKPERAAARRMVLSVVTKDGTRADRDRSELCPDDDPAAVTALEAMIRGRLLVARNTATGEATYELAHDSLIAAWSTLRGWRDEAAGQRGLRMRLGAAADEWRRLDRRDDALWTASQLGEAAGLHDLADTDRAFIDASRRAVRRRRIVRIALASSLPAVVFVTWLAIRHQSRVTRDRAVAEHVETAAKYVHEAETARDNAVRERATAFAAFDTNHVEHGESEWKHLRTTVNAALHAYTAAAGELEAAVLIDGSRADVRTELARTIFDHALVAEADNDPVAANEIAARLVPLDAEGPLLAAWQTQAELSVTSPRAVRIELRRYDDHDGRLELGAPIASISGSKLVRDVEAGSYSVELHAADGMSVFAPILIARAEMLALDIAIPPATSIPPNMVFVPAGRFLYGGTGDDVYRRNFLTTVPLHPVATRTYLIARTEVTFADWMEYMRAIPSAERELRRPRIGDAKNAPIMLAGGTGPDDPFVLTYLVEPVHVREGSPIVFSGRTQRRKVRWERMPVLGISFEDANAYTAWLASTGKLRGARPCSDHEWEHAARGADGRTWPTGDRLDADDANIDVTYNRDPKGRAPDEVGSHPASRSPFGVDDLAGNAFEWVADPAGVGVQRGGDWFHSAASAESANRDLVEEAYRSNQLGVRVCADAP